MLRGMARAGEISILIITHKFREVTQFADEVTVLRRGRGRPEAGEGADHRAMAEMMVGGEVPAEQVVAAGEPGDVRSPQRPPRGRRRGHPRAPRRDARSERRRDRRDRGVSGNGQDELLEVLAGQRMKPSGAVQVSGKDYEPTREQMRAAQGAVPARRAAPQRVRRDDERGREHGAADASTSRATQCCAYFVSSRKINETAEQHVHDYGIQTPSIHTPIGKLSGGNVQRSVLARELEGEVDVLVAANPCLGLDFAAVAEIHGRIRAARDKGTAVLLVSADLDEVLALATRVLVMSDGSMVHETVAEGAQPKVLGEFMAGHGPNAQTG